MEMESDYIVLRIEATPIPSPKRLLELIRDEIEEAIGEKIFYEKIWVSNRAIRRPHIQQLLKQRKVDREKDSEDTAVGV